MNVDQEAASLRILNRAVGKVGRLLGGVAVEARIAGLGFDRDVALDEGTEATGQVLWHRPRLEGGGQAKTKRGRGDGEAPPRPRRIKSKCCTFHIWAVSFLVDVIDTGGCRAVVVNCEYYKTVSSTAS